MRVNYQVSVDCADPHLLASFWAQALGWTVEDHTDRIKQLMEQGHVTENDVVTIDGRLAFKEAAAVRDPEAKVASDGLPERGRMLFQVVPEGKPDEPRTGFSRSRWRAERTRAHHIPVLGRRSAWSAVSCGRAVAAFGNARERAVRLDCLAGLG